MNGHKRNNTLLSRFLLNFVIVLLFLVSVDSVFAQAVTTLHVYPLQLTYNDGQATADWSTDYAGTGIYSAHLETLEGADTGSEARIVIDASDVGIETLNDFETMEWVALVSGHVPHLDVYLDLDNDGAYDDGIDDVLIFEYSKLIPAYCDGPNIAPENGTYETQTQVGTFADKGSLYNNSYSWLNSGPSGGCDSPPTEFFWHSLSDWKGGVPTEEANGKTINGSTKVLRLEIEIDNLIAQSGSYVDNIRINGVDTSADVYGLIQDAISAVSDGDIINVASGEYEESIVVDKNITLTGDAGDASAGPGPNAPVVIDPGDCARLISVEASGVNIRGFVLNGNSCGKPVIRIDQYMNNTIIEDNELKNNGKGVDLSPY